MIYEIPVFSAYKDDFKILKIKGVKIQFHIDVIGKKIVTKYNTKNTHKHVAEIKRFLKS